MSLDIQLRVDGEVVCNVVFPDNLAPMAEELRVYDYIWHPSVVRAANLIYPLGEALLVLLEHEDHYRTLEPSNGWGKYEHLVEFLTQYIRACAKFKNAVIEVS